MNRKRSQKDFFDKIEPDILFEPKEEPMYFLTKIYIHIVDNMSQCPKWDLYIQFKRSQKCPKCPKRVSHGRQRDFLNERYLAVILAAKQTEKQT